MRRASRGTSASLLNCMICKIYSKNLIDMKLASYLNSTNVTKISTVLIFYSFSPKNSINLLLHSYSPHNSTNHFQFMRDIHSTNNYKEQHLQISIHSLSLTR